MKPLPHLPLGAAADTPGTVCRAKGRHSSRKCAQEPCRRAAGSGLEGGGLRLGIALQGICWKCMGRWAVLMGCAGPLSRYLLDPSAHGRVPCMRGIEVQTWGAMNAGHRRTADGARERLWTEFLIPQSIAQQDQRAPEECACGEVGLKGVVKSGDASKMVQASGFPFAQM